jgi:hypothetical protein
MNPFASWRLSARRILALQFLLNIYLTVCVQREKGFPFLLFNFRAGITNYEAILGSGSFFISIIFVFFWLKSQVGNLINLQNRLRRASFSCMQYALYHTDTLLSTGRLSRILYIYYLIIKCVWFLGSCSGL